MDSQAPHSGETTRESLVFRLVGMKDWDRVGVVMSQGVSVECRQHALRAALRDCQWTCVTQVLQQGASLADRDEVLQEAVRHSQWSCVSSLISVGVSGQHRDAAFQKAVRHKQWDVVQKLLAAGVSQSQRDVALQRAMQHEQWEFAARLVRAGVGQKQRGVVVQKAVQQEQWQLVRQLVEAGVDQQQRDQAVQAAVQGGQWQLVEHLAWAGVGLAHRNNAVRAAVDNHQWHCALTLMEAGVSWEEKDHALRETVEAKLWAHLPSVVALCEDPAHRELAVVEAIRHCEWTCVSRLVPLGLSQALREYVFSEAVEWDHMDCAVQALKQGVGECHQQRIVDKLFQLNRWNHVVDLLVEGALPTAMRPFALQMAVNYGCYDAFMTIVELQCIANQHLVEALTIAVRAGVQDLFHRIITTNRCRRVFKQLCSTQYWTVCALPLTDSLVAVGERDLALFLAAAHHCWDRAVSLYGDSLVTNRTRKYVLRLAIRLSLWSHVVQLVQQSKTDLSMRRQTFLQAVRQGAWREALHISDICGPGQCIGRSDIEFAVQTCLLHGQWEFVLEYCLKSTNWPDKKALIKLALETCVKEDLLNCFLRIVHSQQRNPCLLDDQSASHLACTVTLELGRCDYVQALCLEDGGESGYYYWKRVRQTALEIALDFESWELARQLVEEYGPRFSAEQFMRCLNKIASASDCWHQCVPFLDAWCTDRRSRGGLFVDEHMQQLPAQTQELADWCKRESAFGNLALYLTVTARNWSLVPAIIVGLRNSIDNRVISDGVLHAVNHGALDAAVSLLESTDFDDDLFLDFEDPLEAENATNLLVKCRERGLYKWVVNIAVMLDMWDEVDVALEDCQDQALINETVHADAAERCQWDLVVKHIDKCSLDDEDLGDILYSAITDGRAGAVACIEKLLDIVDPRHGTSFSGSSWLKVAVSSGGENKEDVVRLCIRAGLAVHQRQLDTADDHPMRVSLRNRHFSLARLLHESGSCSYRELHRLNTDTALKGQLERQGHREILTYLNDAASNPLTLRHLCRLNVVHHLGFRPGRRDRVASLPVPLCVKKYLNFADFDCA